MKINGWIFIISINILVALLFSSCSKEETENEIELYFEIDETQLFAPPEKTEFEIDIFTNTNWKLVSNPDWVEVVSKVDYNIGKLEITVFENENYSSREGKIKIKTINDTFEIQVNQGNFYEDFRKCYVTYDPIGFQGNSIFKVYTQSQTEPNYYWGFTIQHEQNLSDEVYTDQFRIAHCEEFRYNGEEMIPTESSILSIGESEFTYKRIGASGFTGGVHGDEILEEVNFFIDNNLITDLSSEFTMRPCETFTYMQMSIMYKDDISHSEEAEHIKRTSFSDSGYFTRNVLIGKDVVPMNICYGSIVSISTDVGARGYSSDDNGLVIFNRDSNRELEEVNDLIFLWNQSTELSATIKSVFSINNDSSKQYIWDTPYYSKYYRYLQNINLDIGEVWNFETKVTFQKLER